MTDLPEKDELLAEITLANELVWDRRLNQTTINEWLSNFQGDVFETNYERSLALWLLVNFVFYNQHEVDYLCKVVYRDYVHKLITVSSKSTNDALNEILGSTMYVSLGEPSESGAMLMYLFRTANSIGLRDIQPSTRSDFDNIAFIDDVALSEDQNSQAWSYLQGKIKDYPNKNVHLLTLIASEDAIRFLSEKGVSVTNAITLKNESKVFDQNSYVFHLNADHRTSAEQLAEHYGNICYPSNPLGYSDGQYLFGFFYNIPDNTLPIIWSNKNKWKPILRRHHKNYRGTDSNELGFFV